MANICRVHTLHILVTVTTLEYVYNIRTLSILTI